MQKIKKSLLSLFLMFVIMSSIIPVSASLTQSDLTLINIEEFEVTKNQLEDGVAVIVKFNEKGDILSQSVITYDENGIENIKTINSAKNISTGADVIYIGSGSSLVSR